MVRKVLLLLWDGEELMQMQYDNDGPEKKSRGGIKMRQHLCLCPTDVKGSRVYLNFHFSNYINSFFER